MRESHDEIDGDTLMFLLAPRETPFRKDGSVPDSAVYLAVPCGKHGSLAGAYISFTFPLHVDHTYIGEFGFESSTTIRYRENNEVTSTLATIEDNIVFMRRADWIEPFLGRAIQVEDIYGHFHVFHFPAVSLEPLEGG